MRLDLHDKANRQASKTGRQPKGDDSARRNKGSAIQRTLEILEAVALARRPVSATEINATLKLPKASLHRLCGQLEQEGFLQRDLDGKRLRPGRRLKGMVLATLDNSPDHLERRAILEAVSREIGETCNLTVPDGTQMLYVDRVETHWPLRLQFQIGAHVPLHCTASGKLFLSTLPVRRLRRLLDSLPLESRTPNSITDPAALEQALETIRQEQVGTDDEEFVEGMAAVAVPVSNSQGDFVATLATHGPIQRMTLAKARSHLPDLRQAAERLSALLDPGEGLPHARS